MRKSSNRSHINYNRNNICSDLKPKTGKREREFSFNLNTLDLADISVYIKHKEPLNLACVYYND